LDTLNLEDVFLLGDESFWFSREYDGRPAAEENMLKSLKNINLKDCVNLTTQGIRGLAERCRRVEEINLRGCDKVSDATLIVLSTPYEEKYPMCDSFKVLTLSYCPNVTASGIVTFLAYCGVLEELNVSGIISCDDDFLHQLCVTCKTVQKLELQKCVYITDAGLCSLADYMWIEYIDVTGCYKITDDGIEVLTSSCNGLVQIIAKKVSKLTDRSMNAILRNCKLIQTLDIRDCPLITQQAVTDISFYHHSIKIIS
jgi:F-box and leucine-rich repeat protein GRR1